MEAALTAKEQITIPKAVGEHLRVKASDRVKSFIHPDGTVVLLPKLPVTALRGILKWNGPPATLEEMDAAIDEGAAIGRQSTGGYSRARRRSGRTPLASRRRENRFHR